MLVFSVLIGWSDHAVTGLSLMQIPDSMIMGESSSQPLIFLATNTYSLPVSGTYLSEEREVVFMSC